MFLPRFTLRRLLGITAGCAVLSWVVSLAVYGELREHLWAAAISVAVGSIALAFVFSVLFFLAAWLVSLLIGQFQAKSSTESLARPRGRNQR